MENVEIDDDYKHMVLTGGIRVVTYARRDLEKLLSDIKGEEYIQSEDEVVENPSLSYLLSEGGRIITSEGNKIYKLTDEIRSNLF